MSHRILLVSGIAAALLLPWHGDGGATERTPETTHIRPTIQRLRDAVRLGLSRSATFRSLIDRIEDSDVIVHIAPQTRSRGRIAGEMQFAAATGAARYVRITVRTDMRPASLVAMIGHELQHAIEVATDPAVVDSATFDELYQRIGFHNASGTHETHAARAVELRIFREVDR